MPKTLKFSFADLEMPESGSVVVLATSEGLTGIGTTLDAQTSGQLQRAIDAQDFKGKFKSVVEVVAPHGTNFDRISIVGTGTEDELNWTNLGGFAARFAKAGKTTTVLLELGDAPVPGDAIAEFGEGMMLGAYSFDRYKTKPKDDDSEPEQPCEIVLACHSPSVGEETFAGRKAVAQGTILARDLVNAPPNDLGPEEFANEAAALADLGAKVTILGEAEMEELGMGSLLAVGRGSERESKLAVIEWKGSDTGGKPLCFVGKGVVFDTGGISLKPAGGMEDMKGDMGGAAAVIGLMKALAGRKAKVHAIGILGLVENMPDGKAQRPGDIVTSKSGQTIEIINTDAEGRLVLCDALTYAQETWDPKLVINLATLTGAIMVALGNHHAGAFSNNDELADQLIAAGLATEEKVWRMPIGQDYDKLIDSKFADMKNSGGRLAGSITAAQFLHRFIDKDRPWCHLDIAGTAFGSPKTDTNSGWASGFGVRLLDRFVADNHEG